MECLPTVCHHGSQQAIVLLVFRSLRSCLLVAAFLNLLIADRIVDA
jgi:hypothetical protein